MKILNKMVSLLAVIAVMPSAFAATSRVAMNVNTTRLPTTRSSLASIYARASLASTGTTTSSTLLTAAECVDEYTNCMKGSDACGSEFEECTTNPLLHSKMAQCTSVLYQCSSDGISNLFGTSSVTDLGTVASYRVRKTGKEFTGAVPTGINDYEVTKFTYPTTNSVMHQLIEGAAIANRFDTTQCVKKYTNCLKKDDVCGEDFELCTDHDEFSKQQVLCASTLARCQNEAIVELFGSSDTTKFSGGRIEKMVKDGADLAGANAVNTCYKTISTCFSAACAKNPYRCVEGTSMAVANAADFVGAGSDEGLTTGTGVGEDNTAVLTSSDIKKFFKSACEEKIGGNKYCYMTFHEGKTPKASELSDFDERSELFSEAYSTYKTKLNSNLQDIVTAFDTKAKKACLETIKSCAMRSCGGGVGSVCYTRASDDIGNVHINKTGRNYNDIKSACSGAVNLDKNCIYAAKSMGEDGYSYAFEGNSVFNTLFPVFAEGESKDPIGAVEQLNSLLATSYNSAAIAELKKKCQNVAVSCVKSMCGADYVNCYRNRTDIVGGVYNTGSASFDRSMNKMGGVLDYNIVVGLCLLNVQNSSYCDEHLKIAASQAFEKESAATGWGAGDSMATSVRQGWLNGAGSTTVTANTSQVLTGCTVESASDACDAYTVMPCGTVDEDGCNYSKEQYTDFETYAVNNAGETLFQQVLADVEKEAQAKYNAKLTKEQNVCLSNNTGGLMGNSDNGSNFMWVKLRGKKVPASYTQKGLSDKQFVASNDLYGSFCRVRINVLSDDKDIQEELSKESSGGIAYFAVGDAFTCGSWLSKQSLQRITDKKAEAARKAAGEGSSKDKATMAWSTIGGLLGGGALGVGLTESGVLSKALGKANSKFTSKNSSGENTNKKDCLKYVKRAQEYKTVGVSKLTDANSAAGSAFNACKNLNVNCPANQVVWSNGSETYTKTTTVDGQDKVEKGLTSCKEEEDAVKCEKITIPENGTEFDNYLVDLKDACETAVDDGNSVSDKSNKALRIAVPIATAAAGAALGIGISKSVLDKKYEQAEQEAIDQWNADVGNHIKCYIGGEELGSYGEIISFDIN